MKLVAGKTKKLQGKITIPASKSHTIRAIIIASLAEGISKLVNPLFSEDTCAAINACRAVGAKIERKGDRLIVEGWGGNPEKQPGVIDMLNSGTSTNLMIGVLAALGVEAEITGDSSLRSRPVTALAEALTGLGLNINFTGKSGCPPVKISGRIRGGRVKIDSAKSSQYVSSLLLSCPLLEQDSEILIENPSELPYIEMTLDWLDMQNIKYERRGFERFNIFGRQCYKSFEKTIPADWSSAAFPICAAAVTDSNVLVKGVNIHDVQGDKAIVDYLKKMGADIEIEDKGIRIRGRSLVGKDIDLNATPDALPALSVVGCFASGKTRLFNVAQARVKETDRIKVMAEELKKMGADIEEKPDGLIIGESSLNGAVLNGHSDHRVVMALSVAAMAASGTTTIDTAEAVSVTFPDYVDSMNKLNANIKLIQEEAQNGW